MTRTEAKLSRDCLDALNLANGYATRLSKSLTEHTHDLQQSLRLQQAAKEVLRLIDSDTPPSLARVRELLDDALPRCLCCEAKRNKAT